jgi:hypothetical protein
LLLRRRCHFQQLEATGAVDEAALTPLMQEVGSLKEQYRRVLDGELPPSSPSSPSSSVQSKGNGASSG